MSEIGADSTRNDAGKKIVNTWEIMDWDRFWGGFLWLNECLGAFFVGFLVPGTIFWVKKCEK
jgi:hypothetical protein